MTDKIDVLGKQKVAVTVTSEAYALINYENNRERWINLYKWKKANPKVKTTPKYSKRRHEETKDYQAKWSDCKGGQQSGWDDEALTTFEAHKTRIKEFRAQEKENGYPKMKFGQALLREIHCPDMVDEAPQPPTKKQKTGRSMPPLQPSVASLVTIEDE